MIQRQNQPSWSKRTLTPKGRVKCIHRKRVFVEGRPVNSVEYAVSWGVLNKIWYLDELRKKTKSPTAPSYSYIIKTWGNFTPYYRALVKAGMQPRPSRNKDEKRKVYDSAKKKYVKKLLKEDYDLAKFVAQANIKGRTEYREYRKNHAELKNVLPCDETIRKRFGSWTTFFYEVEKCNVDLLITRYVEQSASAGHWLYLKECDKLNLDIRYAMNLLRPFLFNTFCYRKLEMLGLQSRLKA